MSEETIKYIFLFLLCEFIFILTHELGHVIALRKCKVIIYSVELFRRPIALEFILNRIHFKIGFVPMGGSVNHDQIKYHFLSKPQKVLILSAGIIANTILCLLIYILFLFINHHLIWLALLFNLIVTASNLIPWKHSDIHRIIKLYHGTRA